MGGLADRILRGPALWCSMMDSKNTLGEWDRSSKKRSMARDSKAGTVLAIRDEELGVEGKYFPLGGLDLCRTVKTACRIVRMDVEKWART